MGVTAIAAAVGLAPPVGAVSIGDVLGVIDDGLPPSDANLVSWAGGIIDYHNHGTAGTNPYEDDTTNPSNQGPETVTIFNYDSGDLDLPDAVFGEKVQGDDLDDPIGEGYLYGLAKYGGGQDQNQLVAMFYIGGLSFAFPSTFGFDGLTTGGLSHVTLMTEGTPPTGVPDGGATAVLLGLGFLGLTTLVRKRS